MGDLRARPRTPRRARGGLRERRRGSAHGIAPSLTRVRVSLSEAVTQAASRPTSTRRCRADPLHACRPRAATGSRRRSGSYRRRPGPIRPPDGRRTGPRPHPDRRPNGSVRTRVDLDHARGVRRARPDPFVAGGHAGRRPSHRDARHHASCARIDPGDRGVLLAGHPKRPVACRELCRALPHGDGRAHSAAAPGVDRLHRVPVERRPTADHRRLRRRLGPRRPRSGRPPGRSGDLRATRVIIVPGRPERSCPRGEPPRMVANPDRTARDALRRGVDRDDQVVAGLRARRVCARRERHAARARAEAERLVPRPADHRFGRATAPCGRDHAAPATSAPTVTAARGRAGFGGALTGPGLGAEGSWARSCARSPQPSARTRGRRDDGRTRTTLSSPSLATQTSPNPYATACGSSPPRPRPETVMRR